MNKGRILGTSQEEHVTKPLRERLSNAMSSASKADRALATCMLAEYGNLPFENAASLAAKVEVSEPTVGWFCRAIGYEGFKDLKKKLRNDMGDQPWLIKDRLRDLQERAWTGVLCFLGNRLEIGPQRGVCNWDIRELQPEPLSAH